MVRLLAILLSLTLGILLGFYVYPQISQKKSEELIPFSGRIMSIDPINHSLVLRATQDDTIPLPILFSYTDTTTFSKSVPVRNENNEKYYENTEPLPRTEFIPGTYVRVTTQRQDGEFKLHTVIMTDKQN